jgi:Arginine deiminase
MDGFVLAPLPNLLYQRDTSTWIYGGVSVNAMRRRYRARGRALSFVITHDGPPAREPLSTRLSCSAPLRPESPAGAQPELPVVTYADPATCLAADVRPGHLPPEKRKVGGSTPRLERRVLCNFTEPGSAETVLELLAELPHRAGYDHEMLASERVQAAVVLLADSDIGRLHRAINLAAADWLSVGCGWAC